MRGPPPASDLLEKAVDDLQATLCTDQAYDEIASGRQQSRPAPAPKARITVKAPPPALKRLMEHRGLSTEDIPEEVLDQEMEIQKLDRIEEFETALRKKTRVILRETEPGSLAYAFDEDDEEEEMQGQDTAASSSRTRGKRNKIVKIPGRELSDNDQDQAGEAPRQEAPQPRTQDRFALDETKGTHMFPQTSSTEACRSCDSATDFFCHSCGDVACSLCRVDGHGCSCSAQFLTHEGTTGPGLVDVKDEAVEDIREDECWSYPDLVRFRTEEEILTGGDPSCISKTMFRQLVEQDKVTVGNRPPTRCKFVRCSAPWRQISQCASCRTFRPQC